MNRYQEWAKRNWPSCSSVDDPDRFVEFSQADLDAYAERAFAAGCRGRGVALGHQTARAAMFCRVAKAAATKARQDHRRGNIYHCLAGLGWLAFVGLAIFGRGL